VPEGFEPHTELARIVTLREMMQSCRELTPKVMANLEELLDNEDPDIQLRAMQMVLDRGFGKPRQSVTISDSNTTGNRLVILPDNGRAVSSGPIIESDG
jgi:hypothetical protein